MLAGEDGRVAPDHSPTMAEADEHRAGFAYGLPLGEPKDRIEARYRQARILGAADLIEMVARLATVPLFAHQPGILWRYSTSMDVQGAIIERLSGQRPADFMRTRIFAPLGMADTAFFVPPEKRHCLAHLYSSRWTGPEKLAVNPMRPDRRSRPASPWGAPGSTSARRSTMPVMRRCC